MKKQGRENKNQKVKKVQTKPEAFVSKPAVKPAVKVVAMSVNRVPTPARLRARFAKYQLFPPRPAYAEGFGPDPKLAKFFKTPISPKIAGLVSLFAAVCLVALTGTFVFTSIKRVNQTAIIKSATVKQLTANVAGQPTQWSVLVSKSIITKDSYLAKLPKNAKNIKVTTITAKQAQDIFKTQTPKISSALTLQQKKKIATANQPKSFFAASLLDSISKFFAASIDEGVQAVVDAVNPDITATPDATVVDLSSQAPAEPAQSPAGNEAGEPPAPSVEQTPAPETPAPAPTPAPETPSDVVQVNYETPAPTISEQTTDTGKLVTVSSSVGTIDCETLNPVRGSASNGASPQPAGLLNGFTNAFKSIEKFFTADLEQAASDAVQTVVDQITPPVETPAPVETPVVEPAPVETPAEPAPVEALAPSSTEISAPAEIPAPSPAEQAYQDCLKSQAPLTDVLAFTNIPEIYKVGEESKIHIKWKNNGNQDVAFHAYDTNNNGKLDYVEWTVPHLSDQIFEIIFISKAMELDASQNIVADIYDQVSQKEGTWADGAYATVIANNYVRVTFEQVLDNTKDITIYMRPTPGAPNGHIEVYPVYDDGQGNLTEGPMLDLVSDGQNPDFSNIDHDGKYRVLLTNLQTPTDVFDLKIVP